MTEAEMKAQAEKEEAERKAAEEKEKQQQEQQQQNEIKTFSEEYVKGIRAEAAKYRTKAKELEEKLGELDRIDVEEYARLKKEKEEAERQKLEAKGEFDKLKEQIHVTHQKELGKKDIEIAARDARIAILEAELDKSTLDNAIAIELATVKSYNPKLLAMQLSSEAKIEKLEDGRRFIKLFDETGSPKVNGKGEAMTIRERIADMKQDETFAILFEGAMQGAGSRTGGGTGKPVNPFKAESFNLSLQGQLVRDNPKLARQMAAECGIPLDI